MKKYLMPLGIFVLGNLCLLVAFLFLPAIGTAGTQLAADTADKASYFWGWTWAVGGIKLWVLLGLELAVLYGTGKAFLKVH